MNTRLRIALRYYRSLPTRRLAGYLLAVFVTFASIGFIADTWHPPIHRPLDLPAVMTTAALDGAIAVLFALSSMRSWWFLPAGVALMVFGLRGVEFMWSVRAAGWSNAAADAAAVQHRLMVDSASAIGLVVLGYALSTRFIRAEGVRQTRLRAEMDLAKEIHGSLVPPVALTTAALEVCGRSVPSSEVGGDLVDAFEHDGRLLASIADVSGHGVSAGTLMAMLKSALRLELPRSVGLDHLLADLNGLLVSLLRPGRFVTLACLRFDGSGSVDYALAGHHPILRIRAAGGAVERLENPNLPLGVQADASFQVGRVAASPGDLFAIFTDGMSEVPDGAGREFGIERLERLLLDHASRPLADIERLAFEAVERYGRRADDQTLLLVRVL